MRVQSLSLLFVLFSKENKVRYDAAASGLFYSGYEPTMSDNSVSPCLELSFQHYVKANKRRKEKDSVNNVGGNREGL